MIEPIIFFDGEFMPESEVRISPISRGIFYGDGCFETLRSYSGKFLRLELHHKRLLQACDYLDLNFSHSYADVFQLCRDLIKKNSFSETDAIIRMQLWRKGSGLYDMAGDGIHVLVTVSEIENAQKPLRLKTSPYFSIPETSLSRRYKLSNFLNYALAHRAVQNAGYDDALMLNQQNFVSETATANIFWVKGKKVFSPSDGCDLLPGVTREIILEIFEQQDFSFRNGAFSKKELLSAQAVFITNSIKEIAEVTEIDGTHFDADNPLIESLKKHFDLYKRDNLV